MELDVSTKTGVSPKDCMEKGGVQFNIAIRPDGSDTLEISERKRKDGKGKFIQYNLHLEKEGAEYMLQYLFLRDLVPIVKAYGTDSTTWVGKPITISGTQGEKYVEVLLKA